MLMFMLKLLFASEEPILQSKTAQQYGNVSVGEPLLSFRGWTLDGKSIGLSTLLEDEQKPDLIIISYVATWCAPCKKGVPHIEALAQADPKIKALYISIDTPNSEKKLEAFVRELDIKSPVVWDKYHSIAKRHGVIKQEQSKTKPVSSSGSVPKTFILDEAGNVLSIFVEEGADFSEQLHLLVSANR